MSERASPIRWSSYRNLVWVIPCVLLALLLRGVSIYQFAYPTGPDYGLHLLFAEQVLQTGALPDYAENYQLGLATWPLLPGGPLIFGIAAAVSGESVFSVIHVVLFFAVVEVIGTSALAYQVFRRTDAAAAAGAITAALPLLVDMMTWAGYPNLIAVSLFPICFAVWLRYWQTPNARWLLVLTLLLCGTASIHHLSTLWLVLTLGAFSVAHLLTAPRATLRRLIPLGIACAIVGLPIALDAIALTTQQDAAAVLTGSDRFDSTRVTWEIFARVITPMGLLLIAGVPLYLRSRQIDRASRLLIGALLLITLLFCFGWLFGLRFYYTRALYFLTLPIAFGGASLIIAWKQRALRWLTALVLIPAIAISGYVRAQTASAYFEIVTPDLIEAVTWLDEYSAPDDVIVTGTFFGFQLTHLIDRPHLAALTPDLISNAEILPLAADATAIMMGLDGMDSALLTHNVRFVVVRTRLPDIPDPDRSRRVMEAHPRLRLVFRNADALIYEVR